MYINSLLEHIENCDIVLPDIQRDFVWEDKKIEKLFDSIMRDYPLGIILLWETYNDIQYREFEKNFRSNKRHSFKENTNHKRLKLVLDGQQRLQSLYLCLYGENNGRFLYFDILSGKIENDDFKEDKYIFRFFTSEEAQKTNMDGIARKTEDGDKLACFQKVSELRLMSTKERQRFRNKIIKKFGLSDDDELRLDFNLSHLCDVLSTDPNILKVSTIDENLARESKDRKNESDVLEAFIRINRQGTKLNRSDLLFSILKLNWKQSATKLPDFIEEINSKNDFEIDIDFVIRCLFAVSDLGTKFDIDILRKKKNIKKIQEKYDLCCDSIRSTLDFVRDHCWIESSKLIGGYFNLIPFVYYLSYMDNHLVPNVQIDTVRKCLYLFGFTSPFSRYADSRLGKFIQEELQPLAEKKDAAFPIADAVYWVNYWERIGDYGSLLIQGNPSLALHLLQQRSGAKVLYKKNAPQIDHIFPRSVLLKKKVDEAEVDHFANYWILAKHKNQNKSKKDPADYFSDVTDSELKRALIDRDLLDYSNYKKFLRKRERLILNQVAKKLSISKNDFNVKHYYKID